MRPGDVSPLRGAWLPLIALLSAPLAAEPARAGVADEVLVLHPARSSIEVMP